MEEELKKLVAKTLPNPNQFIFKNNLFSCYVQDLHLTIRSTNKKFRFSLTLADRKNLTADLIHAAGRFTSLSELEEGLTVMRQELERRGLIDRDLPSEVESSLVLVPTYIAKSNTTENTVELSTKPISSPKIRRIWSKQTLMPVLAVFCLNLVVSFFLSRIWVQTMLQDLAEEKAKELIQLEEK